MEVGHSPPKVVEEAFDHSVYVVGGDSGEELRSVGVERARSAVDGDGVPSTLAFGSLSLPSPIASEDGGRVAKPSTGGGGLTTKDGSSLVQVGQLGLQPLIDSVPSGGNPVRRSALVVGLIVRRWKQTRRRKTLGRPGVNFDEVSWTS
nr:hypothetical protein Iba_chr04aCG14530 [Ipomoea batatas]